MNWWKVLKNAKISGKTTGKGSSFDASKIKINIDKNDCCEKLSLDIQNFVNHNSTVMSSFFRLEDTQDFEGIGHRYFENLGNIYPSPTEMSCDNTAFVYIKLDKLAEEIRSIPDSGKLADMILPLKLKHYENSEYPAKDIKEWHQLKDSFYHEWHHLREKVKKCPDLLAAIKKQGG